MSPRKDAVQARSIALLEDGAYHDYLMNAIASASKSLWAHIFSFNFSPADDGDLLVRSTARALIAARKRGVDVRILLGGNARRFLTIPAGNLLASRFLSALGVDCRIYNNAGTRDAHAKFFLIDGETLVCGSHNWSPRAFARGMDTSIAVQSPETVRIVRPFFLEAWKTAQRPPRGSDVAQGIPLESTLCSPEAYERFRTIPKRAAAVPHEGTVRVLEDGKYYTAVIAGIREARETIRISMFFFSQPPSKSHPNYALIGELLRAHGRGVDIRIVIDTDRETDVYQSRRINKWVKDYLTGKGIAVRFDAPDSVNHSKFMVADGRKVLMGSHNWTSGSFRRLHDLSLEIHSEEIAALCSRRVDGHFAPALLAA